MKLLTASTAKMVKADKAGYLNLILHLAPATLSGKNVCPKASNGCAKTCLNTAGRGQFNSIQRARIAKTLRYFNDRAQFELELISDINSGIRKAERMNKTLAVRLNGTSDLPGLAIRIAQMFPAVQFYDYTKIARTFERDLPANYHLTFSRSESNDSDVMRLLELGHNVAAVFAQMPKTWHGKQVIDGDKNDLRFLDPKGIIVGLSAKGKAKKDTSGFVIL